MLLISPLIDSYLKMRLKNKNYRIKCYKKALAKKLRESRLGHALIRNLNNVMEQNIYYHAEFSDLLTNKTYQQAFWESDLGYLWYKGNMQQQNKYFDLALTHLKENKYKTHIDIGCGWGELSHKVAKLEFIEKAIGIDISEDIITKARELNHSTKAIYQYSDISKIEEKYDLITLFGSTDYITPNEFQVVLEKVITLCENEVIIVNSLRKIKFEDSLKLSQAIEIKRYDTGYVQPINNLLSKLRGKYAFTYTIDKFGLDSSLTIIKMI